MALIVVFAVLVNFSTFANGSVGLDFGQEIEINRALIEADPELSAGLCGQSIEAWDAGDYAAFFELRAQELEDPAQGMKSRAELYHAMAADAADAAYKRVSELPAIEYLAYADKGLEWPATWNLSRAGLMSEGDWIYARRWGGVIQAGFCLALALLAARMQRRGEARLASAGGLGRRRRPRVPRKPCEHRRDRGHPRAGLGSVRYFPCRGQRDRQSIVSRACGVGERVLGELRRRGSGGGRCSMAAANPHVVASCADEHRPLRQRGTGRVYGRGRARYRLVCARARAAPLARRRRALLAVDVPGRARNRGVNDVFPEPSAA